MSKKAWLARLSIALVAGAVVVLVVFAGLHSIGLIAFTAAGLCVTVACAYWFLANRGVLRWIAFTLAALAPAAVAAIFAVRAVLWVAIAVIAMLLTATAVARVAMRLPAAEPAAEREAERPKHPFLIMNPRSGGGKVGKFGLKQKAESLGAEVAMLEGPGYTDVATVAERAVSGGADLLGVAGGDGTQALVAGIAAAHGLPFLCISAGTRNHFAMDLGLDRDDPAACLNALRDGIERRIDLGLIGNRTFVNNASFGVYAEIVKSPAYRDDKRGTTLQMLPDLLRGDGGRHKLAASVGETTIEAPQALLVSNNAYEITDIAGLGRRDRLDAAELGVIAIKVDNAAQAIGLVRAGRGTGLLATSSREVTVDSPQPQIPVGIDGETVLMPTPVHCSVRPGALRVVVPRDRPGVPVSRSPLSLPRLAHLAVLGRGLPSYDGLMSTPNVRQRTAIVTVDDDPGVSRAVARDLRRRYGEQHRIVRAESGAAALEALSQMKLRGEQTAVILADYRMPEMNGIEFLERAMDIYPGARRALLTAYADTGAAIDAINVVDLDYYLLKPWDPPEEKLYPVVDALLEAWLSSDHRPVPELKLVGHRWSARSSQVREFLARNQVPYRWYAADEPEGRRLLEAAEADDLALPVVITADGGVLVEPTEAELADRVGLATTPSTDFYDLVVVGGGPAGLGSAVYGASEGLRTLMVERLATGGQAGQSSRIENYLGFPDGVSGAQLTSRARRQAAKFGAEILTTREVIGLEANGSARTVKFSDGTAVNAHTVILATGVSYRQLRAPGLAELTGTGVFYGSALTETTSCADNDVFIVGGANSAGQAAVYLARTAKSVTILVRGPSLRKSMSYYLIQQIEAIPNIRVRVCTEVIEAQGDGRLERLTLRDDNAGRTETIDAHWLFVFIGAAPLTDWLDGVVLRDDRGFILAGPDLPLAGSRPKGWPLDRPPYHLETSVPGVFAAGDVRAESAKRVASAVGEGAMAVMLVHRYLEKL